MERETDRNTYLLQEDENKGVVQIADDVVVTIASLAAAEAEGVTAAGKGVKVEVIDKKVKVDLAVKVGYGYSIPATCQKVQSKVTAAIVNMTGLEVTEVNVRIVGLDMQKNK